MARQQNTPQTNTLEMLKRMGRKGKSILKKIAPRLVEKINTRGQRPIIRKSKNLINKISPTYTILNGPFVGMKYPTIDISELALVPKIIGSYESHLTPLINELVKIPYDNIIDVGCAEGYYAVGFAKQLPTTTIHCFDINDRDLGFCQKMAEFNNLFNLTYNKFCSPDTLINFDFGKRSLIFCDCEGYELELFTEEVIPLLNLTDVLIELHDIHNSSISSTILKRFNPTHNVAMFNNRNIDYSQFQNLDYITPKEKEFAILEHRGGLNKNMIMEWAFFTPKNKDKIVGLYV